VLRDRLRHQERGERGGNAGLRRHRTIELTEEFGANQAKPTRRTEVTEASISENTT
jgi:hypothetical protein